MSADMRHSDTSFSLREDLYGVSVAQLKERLVQLQAEIVRIEEELTKKESDLSAADLLFAPKP